MEKETDPQLTAGQCLPAPDCCALADALALVEFGPCRGSDRPQDWMPVASAMCAHCEGAEDVNFAAARIIASEYRKVLHALDRLHVTCESAEPDVYRWYSMQPHAKRARREAIDVLNRSAISQNTER